MIYYIFALLASVFAYLSTKSKKIIFSTKYTIDSKAIFMVISFSIYYIPAAIRYGIGQDYFYTYTPMFNWIANGDKSLISNNIIQYNEIGFTLLNKLISLFTLNAQYLFVITSFISLILIYRAIIENSVDITMSVFCVVLGSYYMFNYSAIRQGLAIAIFAYAIKYIERREIVKYIISILIAASIHTIAYIYLPMYYISKFKINKKTLLLLPIITIIILNLAYPIIINIISFTRFSNYINADAQYHIFLMMTIFFIYYIMVIGYNDKDMKYRIYTFIMLMAVISSALSKYVNAADRIVYAFYYTNFLILPYIYKKTMIKNKILIISVLCVILIILWIFEHIYYDQFSVFPYRTIFE